MINLAQMQGKFIFIFWPQKCFLRLKTRIIDNIRTVSQSYWYVLYLDFMPFFFLVFLYFVLLSSITSIELYGLVLSIHFRFSRAYETFINWAGIRLLAFGIYLNLNALSYSKVNEGLFCLITALIFSANTIFLWLFDSGLISITSYNHNPIALSWSFSVFNLIGFLLSWDQGSLAPPYFARNAHKIGTIIFFADFVLIWFSSSDSCISTDAHMSQLRLGFDYKTYTTRAQI